DGKDVDVAARVAPAAQAADGQEVEPGARSLEPFHDRGGGRSGLGQEVAPGRLLPLAERLEDEHLLLRAHALQAADAPGLGGLLQVLEAGDAEVLIEARHGLRPKALEAEDVEQRDRELLQE